MARDKHYICRDCGAVSRSLRVKRGSKAFERMLYYTVLLPGPFYTLYRILAAYRVCTECKSRKIVKLGTIEGDALLDRNVKAASAKKPS